jgi:DNA polymerase-1
MLALLDGDIFAYRAAAASENDPEDIAIFRLVDSIEITLAAVGADSYQVWLSDSRDNNFRRTIYPEYKANRTDPDPIHLAAVKKHLVDNWQATVALGQEADDALGIEQMKGDFGSSIICSIDKDLKQIPGRHYNHVRREFDDISTLEGTRWFYKQLLIGDRIDNIFGVYGLGPKKSAALLDHVENEQEMFEIVSSKYDSMDRLLMNGKVVWIRKQENQIWEPPIG